MLFGYIRIYTILQFYILFYIYQSCTLIIFINKLSLLHVKYVVAIKFKKWSYCDWIFPSRSFINSDILIFSILILIMNAIVLQWVEMSVSEVNSRSVIVEVPTSRKIIKIIEELPVTPPVATATMAPFSTNLNDVFISVKTTRHYHHSRLPPIIDTWFQFAKNQVNIFPLLVTVCSFITWIDERFLNLSSNFAVVSLLI